MINPLYGGNGVAVTVGSVVGDKGVPVKVGEMDMVDAIGKLVVGELVGSGSSPLEVGSSRWMVYLEITANRESVARAARTLIPVRNRFDI